MTLITHFLVQIRQFVRAQDGDSLRAWLQVSPQSPQQYHNLAAELRNRRPQDVDADVEDALPQDDDELQEGQGAPWPGLIAFVKDYFGFWRDVNWEDLLRAHQLLSGLVK